MNTSFLGSTLWNITSAMIAMLYLLVKVLTIWWFSVCYLSPKVLIIYSFLVANIPVGQFLLFMFLYICVCVFESWVELKTIRECYMVAEKAQYQMSHFRLTPPEEFNFRCPDDWPRWKHRFEQFWAALGLEAESETKQVSTLLYCLGEESEAVLSSTNATDERQA